MPDAKDNAKLTGDTHPPEVDLAEQRMPRGRPASEGAHGDAKDEGLGRELDDEARAGKGINQAGYLKDKDGAGEKAGEKKSG